MNKLAEVCFPAQLSMLGYFNPHTKPQNSALPYYGTQMFAVRGDFCDPLAAHMSAFPANDIDMYFIGPAPCQLGCTSRSLAGQKGHASDCDTKRTYKHGWTVMPPQVDKLTLEYLDGGFRKKRWLEYVSDKRQQVLFNDCDDNELFQNSLM